MYIVITVDRYFECNTVLRWHQIPTCTMHEYVQCITCFKEGILQSTSLSEITLTPNRSQGVLCTSTVHIQQIFKEGGNYIDPCLKYH